MYRSALPKPRRAKVEPISTETVRTITSALPKQYRALATLAAGTGLRQGEAFGLTVDRVDFLRRRVTIDRQLTTVTGRAPEFGPPKTTSSVRTVPLPTVVVDALAVHLAAFGTGPDGLLFTNELGDRCAGPPSGPPGERSSRQPELPESPSTRCGTTPRAC